MNLKYGIDLLPLVKPPTDSVSGGYDRTAAREIVRELYDVLLGREPDLPGSDAYIELLCKDKHELLSIFRNIAFSEEALARSKTRSALEQAAMADTSNTIPSGLTDGNVREVILKLFRAFLAREPEAQASDAFAAALLSRHIDLVAMIDELDSTEERKLISSLSLQDQTIDPTSSQAQKLALYFTGDTLSEDELRELAEASESEFPTAAELVRYAFTRPRVLRSILMSSKWSANSWPLIKQILELPTTTESFAAQVSELKHSGMGGSVIQIQPLMGSAARLALATLLNS